MRRIFIYTVSSILLVGHAHAQTAIKSANRQLDFAIGSERISYLERDQNGKTSDGVLDTETGSQPAAKLTYTLQDDYEFDDMYLYASVAYARGKTQYNGYLQSGGVIVSPYQTVTHVSTFDIEARLGKGFAFFSNNNLQLTPYVAYGYHLWKRDLSFDPYGYLEVYEHHSMALGALHQVSLTSRLVASLDVSLGKTLNPNMRKSRTTKFNLGSRPIASAGIKFDYALNDDWHISSGYHFTRYKYGESPPLQEGAVVLHEPESKTVLHNIYFSVGASF